MPKKKGGANLIGSWAFLIGVVIAVVLGLFNLNISETALVWVLAVIGILVGLLNVGTKESDKFLLSGAVLVVVGSFASDTLVIVEQLSNVMNYLMIIFAPATIIVALKSVFSLAKG